MYLFEGLFFAIVAIFVFYKFFKKNELGLTALVGSKVDDKTILLVLGILGVLNLIGWPIILPLELIILLVLFIFFKLKK